MQLETNPVTQLQMQGANLKNKTIRIIVSKIVFHHGALVNISQNEAVEASQGDTLVSSTTWAGIIFFLTPDSEHLLPLIVIL